MLVRLYKYNYNLIKEETIHSRTNDKRPHGMAVSQTASPYQTRYVNRNKASYSGAFVLQDVSNVFAFRTVI